MDDCYDYSPLSHFQLYPPKFFKNWEAIAEANDPGITQFIADTIASMDAEACRDKTSEEKTMYGDRIMSPKQMNAHIKACFKARKYFSRRVNTFNPDDPDAQIRARDLPYEQQAEFFAKLNTPVKKGFMECDFLGKNNAVEAQFGKYPFVEEDREKLFESMDLGLATTGAIIIPMKSLLSEMSTGPSNWQTVTNKWLRRCIDTRSPHPLAVFGIDYVR